ncbi:hypothetical protein [Actinomadura sp. DC4]|uniref:hypothetical protein n=1 Tax=Actinomadura sp. DC4 TaxID=3055069 RepID=UPI0025AFAB1B|nr:hypothetical protein [Actinomadura sp. DC4]MDN3354320.1 hypothetical protein [Actinomadura sp. DC4]
MTENALTGFYPAAEDTRFDDAPLPSALVAPQDERFTPNEEIAAIRWWSRADPPAGDVAPLDLVLGRLAR